MTRLHEIRVAFTREEIFPQRQAGGLEHPTPPMCDEHINKTREPDSLQIPKVLGMVDQHVRRAEDVKRNGTLSLDTSRFFLILGTPTLVVRAKKHRVQNGHGLRVGVDNRKKRTFDALGRSTPHVQDTLRL